MIDDTIFMQGIMIMRDAMQRAQTANEDLKTSLVALGIPESVHPSMERLILEGAGVARQINTEIALKAEAAKLTSTEAVPVEQQPIDPIG